MYLQAQQAESDLNTFGMELLHELLNAAVDVFMLVDAEGRVVMCNKAVEALLGFTPEELRGNNIAAIVPEPDASKHDAYMADYQATGKARVIGRPRRVQARHKEGHLVPVSLAVSPIRVQGRLMFSGVLRDATRSDEREQALRRRNDELKIQAAINAIIQESRSVDALIEATLRCLIGLKGLEVMQKAGAFVRTAAPWAVSGRGCAGCGTTTGAVGTAPWVLQLQHTVGEFSEEFLERESWVMPGRCLCGRAAMLGEVMISANCDDDPRHDHTYEGMTPHGHYIIPIKVEREVYAVIFLYTEPDPLSDARRRSLLETIGVQLGCAIERLLIEERLLELATRDELTGVMNRRSILKELRLMRVEAEFTDEAVTVALMDIDHFKRVNDTYGHSVGDEVLVEVTRRVGRALRSADRLGRYGGEEFLLVMPGCALEEAPGVLERVQEALSGEPIETEAGPLQVTASIGVARYASILTEASDEEAIKRADEALYRAKEGGRARVEVQSAR